MTNQPLPPSFRQVATISTPAKCSRSGIQSDAEREEEDAAKDRFGDLGERDEEEQFLSDEEPDRGCSAGKNEISPREERGSRAKIV